MRDETAVAPDFGASANAPDPAPRDQENDKLEAIGRLAGGIAHDFNNLLTVILGFTDMAAKEIPEGSPAHASLAEVQAAGQRAAELTRQLLAFGRRQTVRPLVLDLGKAVAALEGVVRRRLGERVELVLDLASGLPPVQVDPEQLERVILNLAANARDAMPGKGRLTLTTRAAPPREVELVVEDDGPGLPEEARLHLFEPFFTTKTLGRGTGMGLAEVHGIVAQSHGRVEVASRPGEGTSFHVFLPAVELPQSRRTPALPLTTIRGGAETILLVDDDDLVRRLSRQALSALGYRVHEASDGESALQAFHGLAAAPPDILVSDLKMPGMRGDQLGALLKAERPELRVLYISGFADSEGLDLSSPTSAFLQKPFTPSVLAAKVREMLDRA